MFLYVKLVPNAEDIIGEYQGGFRRGTLIKFLLPDKYWKNIRKRI